MTGDEPCLVDLMDEVLLMVLRRDTLGTSFETVDEEDCILLKGLVSNEIVRMPLRREGTLFCLRRKRRGEGSTMGGGGYGGGLPEVLCKFVLAMELDG